jgi:hypothetical protein
MMNSFLPLALLLALAPPTTPTSSVTPRGEDVAIAVAAQTEIYVPVVVKVMNGAAKSSALFEVTPTPSWERQTGKTFEFTGPPGTYTVTAFYVEVAPDLTPLLKKLRASTTISGVPPPPGPTPPGPTPPGPTPPGPQPPTPTAGMIDAPGFHVLIKYDRDNFNAPASEISILNSESVTSVRQHLKNVCPPVADGQGWRMYPVPAGGVIAPWKAPYERNQGELPTMVVSKNGKGWEGSIKGWTPEQVIAKCKEIEALP